MPEAFAPAVGQRFAGRFELRALLRGSGPARVFAASDGSATPLTLVLFDPAACTPTTWAELTRVVTAATEAALAGLVPLRSVAPALPDPPFCFADPPVGWSFDRLRQGGPSPWQKQDAPLWDRALRLGERAAAILAEVHAVLGVPHRALTAQRLVVTEADELRILDFGVGALEPHAGRLDDCGYRAPEQTGSRGDVRSDVFSLASVLFELISGERPSPKFPPRLRSLVPGVPQAVDDLFAEALAIEPWRRYADMGELREALRDALGLGPAPAARPKPSPAAASPQSEPEVAVPRSDEPILPGSPSPPAPASAAPPSFPRSVVSSPPGGVAPPPWEPPPSPSPPRSIVSAPPGGAPLPPVEPPSPMSARSNVPTPPRGPLLPPLELPSSPMSARSNVSTPPRGPLLPPVEPRAVTPMLSPRSASSQQISEAPAANRTEIDWTRPRPGTPSPNARPLRYSKLVQLDADEAPPDPDRPPAAKTEILPQSLSEASFTPARTEILPQSLAQASFTPARTEILPQSLAQASFTPAKTELLPQSPELPVAARTEILPQSMARLRVADDNTSAARTELFVANGSAPVNRAGRTEIFVGDSAAELRGRTDVEPTPTIPWSPAIAAELPERASPPSPDVPPSASTSASRPAAAVGERPRNAPPATQPQGPRAAPSTAVTKKLLIWINLACLAAVLIGLLWMYL